MEENTLSSLYKIKDIIGQGGFGCVYSATCKNTRNQVAIKVANSRIHDKNLRNEYKILQGLQKYQGFPTLYKFGRIKQGSYMAMELLQLSMKDKVTISGLLNQKSTKKFLQQAICRLRVIHRNGILHYDIKPSNLMLKIHNNSEKLYIIDFGISRQYLENGKHIQIRRKNSIYGTLKYCSINANIGLQQSRRDDLESLFYTFIYLTNGQLAWSNEQKDINTILRLKQNTKTSVLCKGLHPNYAIMLDYVKSLDFCQKPDYEYLISLIRQIGVKEQIADVTQSALRTRNASIKRLINKDKLSKSFNDEITLVLDKAGPNMTLKQLIKLKSYKTN